LGGHPPVFHSKNPKIIKKMPGKIILLISKLDRGVMSERSDLRDHSSNLPSAQTDGLIARIDAAV
jgi:hypothetical protein